MDQLRSEEAIAKWEEVADLWDAIQGDSGDRLRREVIFPWVLSRLEDPTDRAVVDLGCGNGALCRVLARAGAWCLGIDGSTRLVDHARRRRFELGLRSDYSHADLTRDEPPPARAFDAATAIFVLQDVPDPAAVARHAREALAPGGKLLAVLESHETLHDLGAHATTERAWVSRRLGATEYDLQRVSWGPEAYTYTFARPLSVYATILSKAGFEIVKAEPLRPILPAEFARPPVVREVQRKFVGLVARRV